MTSRTYSALWWSAVGPICQNFRLNGLLTDLTLTINKSNKFRVHKLILACASGYFENCAKEQKLNDVYYLDNINESDFQILLNFMYGEPLVLDEHNVHGILAAAKALRFDSAMQHCQDFLHYMMHRQEVSITDESFIEATDNLDTTRISSTFLASPSLCQNAYEHKSTLHIPHSEEQIKFEQISNPDDTKESTQLISGSSSDTALFPYNQIDHSFLNYQNYNQSLAINLPTCSTDKQSFNIPKHEVMRKYSAVDNILLKSRSESPDVVFIGSQEPNCTTITSTKHPNSFRDSSQLFSFPNLNCISCRLTFDSVAARDAHMQIHMNQMKPYNCEICPFTTKYPQRLRLHRRLVHTHQGVKPFKCPYCPYKASVKSNCRKHVKNIHPNRDIEVITLFHVPE